MPKLDTPCRELVGERCLESSRLRECAEQLGIVAELEWQHELGGRAEGRLAYQIGHALLQGMSMPHAVKFAMGHLHGHVCGHVNRYVYRQVYRHVY